jgi:ankyrin repeat protein
MSAEEELLKAVSDKDLNKLETLLKNGVDINFKDANGHSALSRAVNSHQDEVAKLLLTHGADPNAVKVAYNKSGDNSALAYAIDVQNTDLIRILLDKGAQLNSDKKMTPLIYATQNDKRAVIQELISNSKVDINAKDIDRKTAIVYAIEHYDPAMIHMLLSNGADISIKPKNIKLRSLVGRGTIELSNEDNLSLLPLVKKHMRGRTSDGYHLPFLAASMVLSVLANTKDLNSLDTETSKFIQKFIRKNYTTLYSVALNEDERYLKNMKNEQLQNLHNNLNQYTGAGLYLYQGALNAADAIRNISGVIKEIHDNNYKDQGNPLITKNTPLGEMILKQGNTLIKELLSLQNKNNTQDPWSKLLSKLEEQCSLEVKQQLLELTKKYEELSSAKPSIFQKLKFRISSFFESLSATEKDKSLLKDMKTIVQSLPNNSHVRQPSNKAHAMEAGTVEPKNLVSVKTKQKVASIEELAKSQSDSTIKGVEKNLHKQIRSNDLEVQSNLRTQNMRMRSKLQERSKPKTDAMPSNTQKNHSKKSEHLQSNIKGLAGLQEIENVHNDKSTAPNPARANGITQGPKGRS